MRRPRRRWQGAPRGRQEGNRQGGGPRPNDEYARATGTLRKAFEKFLKDAATILGEEEAPAPPRRYEPPAPVLSEEEQKLKDLEDNRRLLRHLPRPKLEPMPPI